MIMMLTATKLLNGAWQVSAMIDGYLTTRTYYQFTKAAALAAFRAEAYGEVQS